MKVRRREFVAEACGSFVLVFIGVGAVAMAVSPEHPLGLAAVAAAWGLGVALGIMVAAPASEAHLNPAVTLAMAAIRRKDFPVGRIARYLGSQLLGGLAAAAVLAVFSSGFVPSVDFLIEHPSTELTLWQFGLAEAMGTGLLMLVILKVTGRNSALPAGLVPVVIGATVSAVIMVIGPMTAEALNPMRDLAPRLIATILHEGTAFSGEHGAWWIYLLAPTAGALVGALVHELGLGEERTAKTENGEQKTETEAV
ncbi:MAG: MIP/aquaporin family protein [Armatimonadia bacterium]